MTSYACIVTTAEEIQLREKPKTITVWKSVDTCLSVLIALGFELQDFLWKNINKNAPNNSRENIVTVQQLWKFSKTWKNEKAPEQTCVALQ